ncbi:bifunctional 2-C-methyl-D-erythritol 4-phosphate cytidylyltransferase/2-C-methyl-D-erythritol 2,4-cyclodiphosphate synthase [Pseudoroseomonas cervicalis]|uniref:bifunctional 2-C-methyl-D-erythritol 4-phosphate cytidylyltransferase/2-C-methyl-D-erythritol 2,4-cyclodiphosphate synthase n=1 Tax=Teichococcus cervicalis TaxID=204525 RepID=UPI002781D4AA|nr:bifunctional 2-C-methyl-D-erythritol 4-phosphate cytidylyltransferase/2-C-methyl-D-erythritol 2,4-cyclodiphosphate synthase [Pseudoroseomonas cervicalis]MDQ1079171.1 2-C-methyl-D-erythritol 4-phosphate cytidylyltransferase/2-C-methyl-D-erythritol 2,4-cyclodiphosphate synthase [Pseudoroseomonas cervicalis]
MRVIALLLAAGRGTRFGADRPKQYLSLLGQPVLLHAAHALLADGQVDALLPVVPAGEAGLVAEMLRGLPCLPPVTGGATRQASVRAGLEALAADPPELVLVHDGARPLVGRGTIAALLAALEESPGAIPAQPVSDTLKAGEAGRILRTVPRAGLYRAQTPQAFRYATLLDAHRALREEVTDDAAVLEAMGLPVALLPGSESNLKVTYPEDLARAEAALLPRFLPAMGTGFDVHRLVEGRPLILCGITIPHPLGLDGHSDADVGLHALCDAIYGALAEGDIGRHFPPSEAEWKDADSARFLRHAAGRVAARGGIITHADVTLICERPKIGPHADAMRARLAELMEIPVARVSVKATTTEKLGFTGRGEGIAAQAAATLLLPA